MTISKTRSFIIRNKWLFGILTLLTVLVLGWWLRYNVVFSTELIPGINGAYYPVQVRSILQTGTLGIPDFPLLFYLQAALSLPLTIFMSMEDAIMTTVKWTDTILPVFMAIPVMLFAFEFSRSHKKNNLSPVAATLLVGAIAVGNSSFLRLAGDFQKNSAALTLCVTYTYFLYRSLDHHKVIDYIFTALFLGLTCLTHIGVAALTLTISGIIAIIVLVQSKNIKRALLIALCIGLTIGLSLAIVYLYDATRIERLTSIILDPGILFTNSAISQFQKGFGSQVGIFALPNLDKLLLGNFLGLFGLLVIFLQRKSLRPAQSSLLWSASLTALLFASPLIGNEWSQRLSLMAFVPGMIPLIYFITRRNWLIVIPITMVVLFSGFRTIQTPGSHTLSNQAYQELYSFQETLPDEDTLVVAAHGLEWWVAWTMETDITNRMELAVESWNYYDSIYIIEQTNPEAFSTGKYNSSRNIQLKPNTSQQPSSKNPMFRGGNFRLQRLPPETTNTLQEGTYFELSQILSIPEIPATEQMASANQQMFTQRNPVFPGSPPQTGKPSFPIMPQYPTKKNSPDSQFEPFSLETIDMVPREQWGAKQIDFNASQENGNFNPQTNPNGIFFYSNPVSDWLNTIVVHHSALPASEGPREIQILHMKDRGFADIAYHFMIDNEGTLYEGRPLNIRGAHVSAFNTGTIGIVLLGNLQEDQPSPEQISTLNQIIGELKTKLSITHLAGHKDFNPEDTDCPGTYLYPLLTEIAGSNGMEYGTGGYQTPPWKNQ